ncbi:Mpp10 protein-domain-containing protein [Bombardia bombarda]|uniref:U3 small nucleolar ribonucleoprotein protein MPP10 n=1 Tax=Bombardia bombarda TaxID=252184 RepID=A0AA39WGN2_9PEZI|nr:Mpp10 protein-domain-containing protein [Bombardia bombarda]
MAGGTGSTSSSLTSTSHTLTNAPGSNTSSSNGNGNMTQTSAAANGTSALSVLLDSVAPTNRHVFIQPSPLLPAGSLQLAKETLDALAGAVSDQQQVRVRDAKKRKREAGGAGQDKDAVLKIRKLYIDGFETGQIWQQAKKIIQSTLKESSQMLEELEDSGEVGDEEDVTRAIEFGKDGFEVGSDNGSASASSEEAGSDDADTEESEGDDEDEESEDEEVDGEISGEEGVEVDDEEEDDEDEEEGEDEDEEEEEDDDDDDVRGAEFVQDPNGLNDGFFSLEEFNKQSQFFEAQDARADPNTDDFSDDESVDWHADPMSATAVKGEHAGEEDEDEEDEDEDVDMEDAPSFDKKKGKKNAKAAIEDEEEEEEDDEDQGVAGGLDLDLDLTANDVYYKDFFAPPARKNRPGSHRTGPKNLPFERPTAADVERAENDVRRDLFDDLSERSDSDDEALSDVSAGNPKSRRSAHERQQAKLAENIRKLEAELVAKRAWTLAGEATAADRPVNSLLEQDLDFEHVGKPVPIITEEVSESIEELIKRRILAQEFDELLRRRPEDLGTSTRRGLVDIQDTKGKQSLAEIYEEEHIKAANPDGYVSQVDDKLRKDEEEIKAMWKDVCGKLDALSSWSYKPKPAAPTLTVVSDVATVAMEDAQPTTAQGVAGGESMIAPQEVYAPGKENAGHGEVVAKSGLPIARQEMTREDKLRRRRREKERIRKAGGLDATKNMSRGAQARKETMSELKKGGVTVINRKGERMGLDGKKAPTEGTKAPTSGSYKL